MGFLRDLHLNQSPEKWDLSKGSEIIHLGSCEEEKKTDKKGLCEHLCGTHLSSVLIFIYTQTSLI